MSMTPDNLYQFLAGSWIAALNLGVPVSRAYQNVPSPGQHYLTLDVYSGWQRQGQVEKAHLEAGDVSSRVIQREVTVDIWEVCSPDEDEAGNEPAHGDGSLLMQLQASLEFDEVQATFERAGVAMRGPMSDPVLIPDLKAQHYTMQFKSQLVLGIATAYNDPGAIPMLGVEGTITTDNRSETFSVQETP